VSPIIGLLLFSTLIPKQFAALTKAAVCTDTEYGTSDQARNGVSVSLTFRYENEGNERPRAAMGWLAKEALDLIPKTLSEVGR
jgi:hypothetical protein